MSVNGKIDNVQNGRAFKYMFDLQIIKLKIALTIPCSI